MLKCDDMKSFLVWQTSADLKKINFEFKNMVSRREGVLFWKIYKPEGTPLSSLPKRESGEGTQRCCDFSRHFPGLPGGSHTVVLAKLSRCAVLQPRRTQQWNQALIPRRTASAVRALKMRVRRCWHQLEEESLGGPAETRHSGGRVALEEGPAPPHRDWGQEDSTAPLAAALSSAGLSCSCLGSHCCPICKFSVLQCKQEGRRALGREECHGRTAQVLFQVRNEGEKIYLPQDPKQLLVWVLITLLEQLNLRNIHKQKGLLVFVFNYILFLSFMFSFFFSFLPCFLSSF